MTPRHLIALGGLAALAFLAWIHYIAHLVLTTPSDEAQSLTVMWLRLVLIEEDEYSLFLLQLWIMWKLFAVLLCVAAWWPIVWLAPHIARAIRSQVPSTPWPGSGAVEPGRGTTLPRIGDSERGRGRLSPPMLDGSRTLGVRRHPRPRARRQSGSGNESEREPRK